MVLLRTNLVKGSNLKDHNKKFKQKKKKFKLMKSSEQTKSLELLECGVFVNNIHLNNIQ